ncbi:MAG: leucine-rich repeat domain-containing protein [Leptolyngbya sp. SIO1E4]|nr:leucine-rich repeat domain-containing protein [Leptolyngbya sp. SIO1E4]
MTQDELLALIDQAAEEGWTELDLSGQGLTELPPEIGKLTQLETLILGRVEKWEVVDSKVQPLLTTNALTTLPTELSNLKNLKHLDLSGNPLGKIPQSAFQLVSLTSVWCVSTNLASIPACIGQLSNLTTLSLDSNQISEIPACIGQLSNLTELYLDSNQISEIPVCIGQLSNLTTLYLSSNQISEIPACIGQLSNLTTLSLSSNQISEIPVCIGQLSNLTTLSLYRNQISEIPVCIGQLSNLTELYLDSNQISEIPACIGQLSNLTELYLDSNQISEIPACIGQLSNLTELYLSSNQISEIPACIGQLSNLTTLSLSSNQISEIPACIGQLSNLTTLSLDSNQISEIPACIGQLSNLTTLYLYRNQISEIPACIGQLSNLTTLSLDSNQISEIPACIGQLSNLTTLSLSSNQISEIPACIGQLSNLTELYLSSNQISEIPACIGQLSNLTTLYLSSNQISEIPACIGQLSNLTTLYLYSNQISEIPACIGQLSNLTTLYLYRNQISEIPACIGQLSNLTTLYLSSNQISEIPACIGQLKSLEKLDLENNEIEACPNWLENLPNLKTLDLRRNPLPISPEVLGPTKLSDDPGPIEAIFNYLNKLHSDEVKPLNEAKLLLVGQGSVGKTSLVRQLIDGSFNANEPQTDGLKVYKWGVHVNAKDVRLNVWDFGGQEIYHATHQFFLTKRSLYLLVCNCRTSEDENRIEYWLKLIQSFGGASPVIIVGNKKDEQPLDINRKALQQKYPNICAILETSCQTGDGIQDLRAAITREVGKLHDVYNLLPLSWFQVKEQLEAMEKDFITYNEYIGICHQNKISEEPNQEQLINLLHNLGLVLNFRDHAFLQSTNVLNPDWVTQGIYALLSDETLKTQSKGILIDDDLSRVLSPERYPVDRHRYLTELMQEFQLCFALPNCPNPKFLIPGLLPKDEPDDTSLRGDTLEFQYHYRILPESVLSRFIVLAHEKIHNQTCWRSGVMLEYREGDEIYNIARIRADPEDKKIFISVSGREPTRRVFLSLIRDTFTKIHRSFADLEVTEWVPVPGYPDHPPLDYQELLGLEAMGELDYPIGKLRIKVNLRQLLNGYESLKSRQHKRFANREERWFQEEGLSRRIEIVNNIYNTNQQKQGDYQPVTEITNNNQRANIANLVNEAKDSAQVTASNFTQTSGTSTADLLKIINNLRQTATQFPQDVQEDIIIDIEDVEEEIKKTAEQRNIPRLKKRLAALVTAASMIAGSVAAANEFADDVIDLGSKVGIELQLPSAP